MNRTFVWTASQVACALTFLVSSLYFGFFLNRNWVPHDEGILSQSAERVLQGQLPHRDYVEPYTGGLAYLDAAAFRIFGTNLLSLRYMLFLFFLAWVPTVYSIANSFLSPWPAAGITLLGVVWSVPNYAAAMPSWYCLFFATFGSFAIFRYLRKPAPLWLVLAGICGGLSFLMKSPGLLYVAGVLLFLIYYEQSLSQQPLPRPHGALSIYFFFLLLGLLLFSVLLLRLIMIVGGFPEFFNFVLPPLAIVVMLIFREFRHPRSSSAARFRVLFRMLSPFLAGLIAPLCLFFIWYWRNGALHDVVNALTVLHLRRLHDAQHSPPDPQLAILAFVWLIFLTERSQPVNRRLLGWLKIFFAAALVLVCLNVRLAYLMVFESFAAAIPVFVFAGAIWLRRPDTVGERRDLAYRQSMLLLCVTAMCSLVQFPFSTPLYFCYVAPLFLLSLAALLSLLPHASRFNWKIATALAATFAVFMLPFSFVRAMQFPTPVDRTLLRLHTPRAAGLLVRADEASQYNMLVPFIVEHARGGTILVGPDCPEVYFLAGFASPSRSLFEFLEDAQEYEHRAVSLVDRDQTIKVAVVLQHPPFSLDQRNVLTNLVRGRFPMSRQIGDFVVYWRD